MKGSDDLPERITDLCRCGLELPAYYTASPGWEAFCAWLEDDWATPEQYSLFLYPSISIEGSWGNVLNFPHQETLTPFLDLENIHTAEWGFHLHYGPFLSCIGKLLVCASRIPSTQPMQTVSDPSQQASLHEYKWPDFPPSAGINVSCLIHTASCGTPMRQSPLFCSVNLLPLTSILGFPSYPLPSAVCWLYLPCKMKLHGQLLEIPNFW